MLFFMKHNNCISQGITIDIFMVEFSSKEGL